MDSGPESRRERRLAAREERQRVAAEGRQRAQQRKRVTIVGLIVLGVAVVAGLGIFFGQTLFAQTPGRSVPDEGRGHVAVGTSLQFNANPPTSGTHYPVWTRSGVYSETQDKGLWVHSLEHGYVVILYNCPTDCPELVNQLSQFYENAPKSKKYNYQKLVIQPYAEMSSRIAALAWDHIDEMDSFDADRLSSFYKAYLDRGPEDAP